MPCPVIVTSLVLVTGSRGEGGIRTDQENPPRIEPSDEGGAESGAHAAKHAHLEPGLARIVEAWLEPPEAIRKAMVVLAEKGK